MRPAIKGSMHLTLMALLVALFGGSIVATQPNQGTGATSDGALAEKGVSHITFPFTKHLRVVVTDPAKPGPVLPPCPVPLPPGSTGPGKVINFPFTLGPFGKEKQLGSGNWKIFGKGAAIDYSHCQPVASPNPTPAPAQPAPSPPPATSPTPPVVPSPVPQSPSSSPSPGTPVVPSPTPQPPLNPSPDTPGASPSPSPAATPPVPSPILPAPSVPAPVPSQSPPPAEPPQGSPAPPSSPPPALQPSPSPQVPPSPLPNPTEDPFPSPVADPPASPSPAPPTNPSPSPAGDTVNDPSPSPSPARPPSPSPVADPPASPLPAPPTNPSPSPAGDTVDDPSPSPSPATPPSPSPVVDAPSSPVPPPASSPSPSPASEVPPVIRRSPAPSPVPSPIPSPATPLPASPSPSPRDFEPAPPALCDTVCPPANSCELKGVCYESGNTCPQGARCLNVGQDLCVYRLKPQTAVCYKADGPCAKDVMCDGASGVCPSEKAPSLRFKRPGEQCAEAKGDCGAAAVCDGASAQCPLPSTHLDTSFTYRCGKKLYTDKPKKDKFKKKPKSGKGWDLGGQAIGEGDESIELLDAATASNTESVELLWKDKDKKEKKHKSKCTPGYCPKKEKMYDAVFLVCVCNATDASCNWKAYDYVGTPPPQAGKGMCPTKPFYAKLEP